MTPEHIQLWESNDASTLLRYLFPVLGVAFWLVENHVTRYHCVACLLEVGTRDTISQCCLLSWWRSIESRLSDDASSRTATLLLISSVGCSVLIGWKTRDTISLCCVLSWKRSIASSLCCIQFGPRSCVILIKKSHNSWKMKIYRC